MSMSTAAQRATPPGRKISFVQTQAENAGAQEVARQLAHGAAARGCPTRQVFFFRRTNAFDAESDVVFCARERPSHPWAALKLFYRLYKEFRASSPDVVVTFQHYGNLFAAPIARLAGVPTIIANQVSTPAHIHPIVRIADMCVGTLGFYDKIVLNSKSTEDQYAGHPASYRRRCVRIDHGFMDKSVKIDKAQARRSLGLPLDVELLGCAARLHPTKQIDLAIRILPINANQHFAVAGQGPDRERLESLARELNVEDRVHFLGELKAPEIGVLLSAIDGFVFPSATETFGLAPVEAAQAGVPTVVNDLEVLRDVLSVNGSPCALFVDASNSEAFAAAARRIFDDKATAAAISDAGRRLKDRFPLDAMIDEYMKLFALRGPGENAN